MREIKRRILQSQKDGVLSSLQLDLISIGTFTKEAKNLIQSYKQIQYFTLNDCDLVSLDNFPYLPNLSILELSNNKLQDNQLFHLLKNSHISHLMIDENRLKSLEQISILRQLPLLEQLQIAGNSIGQPEFYRDEIFGIIPQLKILDCHDNKGNIAINSDSQDEEKNQDDNEENINMNHTTTPLSRNDESNSDQQSNEDDFTNNGNKKLKF